MKKRVTVYCNKPFSIGNAHFSATHRNLVLTTEQIQVCLENKAYVDELLDNGKVVRLGFHNFDTYNGPSKVTEESNIALARTYKVENFGKVNNPITVEAVSDKKTVVKDAMGTTKEAFNIKENKDERKEPPTTNKNNKKR